MTILDAIEFANRDAEGTPPKAGKSRDAADDAPTSSPPNPATAATDGPAPTLSESVPITLARISPSPHNPRKHFDQAELVSMAETMKGRGVLQPLIVRPRPGGIAGEYELVAGERRLRAARIAGLDTVPCCIGDYTDQQAEDAMLIENGQRADLNPIEEAEGYAGYMARHQVTAKQLAARLQISTASLNGLLLLPEKLPDKAKHAVISGTLPPTTAIMIARIPDKRRRAEAAKEILAGDDTGLHAGCMSYRMAKEHIETKYMRQLKGTAFDRKSLTLVPEAGSCDACPKRTGNNPDLYPGSRADICTDPACFDRKAAAHEAARDPAAGSTGPTRLPSDISGDIEGDDATDNPASAPSAPPPKPAARSGRSATPPDSTATDPGREFHSAIRRELMARAVAAAEQLFESDIPKDRVRASQIKRALINNALENSGLYIETVYDRRLGSKRTPKKEKAFIAGLRDAHLLAFWLECILASNGEDNHPDAIKTTRVLLSTLKLDHKKIAAEVKRELANACPFAAPGDIVRTNYGSGPYVIESIMKAGTRNGKPTWHMTLRGKDETKRRGGPSYLGDYQLQPDGRITNGRKDGTNGKEDEIFVRRQSAAKSRGTRAGDHTPPDRPARTASELGLKLADLNAACIVDVDFDELKKPATVAPLWINGTPHVVAGRYCPQHGKGEFSCWPLYPLLGFRKKFKESGRLKPLEEPTDQPHVYAHHKLGYYFGVEVQYAGHTYVVGPADEEVLVELPWQEEVHAR